MQLELKPLNVLIGANGSGKSNFISFFKMLNYAMSGYLQGYIGESGGADSLLHYGSRYTPEITSTLHFDTRQEKTLTIYGLLVLPKMPSSLRMKLLPLQRGELLRHLLFPWEQDTRSQY